MCAIIKHIFSIRNLNLDFMKPFIHARHVNMWHVLVYIVRISKTFDWFICVQKLEIDKLHSGVTNMTGELGGLWHTSLFLSHNSFIWPAPSYGETDCFICKRERCNYPLGWAVIIYIKLKIIVLQFYFQLFSIMTLIQFYWVLHLIRIIF